MERVKAFSYRNYLEEVKDYLGKVQLYIKSNSKVNECSNQSELLESAIVDVMDGSNYGVEENIDAFVQNLINNMILIEEMVCLENIIKIDSEQIKMWNEEIQKKFELRQEQHLALLKSKDRTSVD